MKISPKTLVVVAALSAGAGLLLPMAGNSQIRIKRTMPGFVLPQDGSGQFSNRKASEAMTAIHIPTDMDKLTARVDALEAKVAAQQTKIAAQDAQLTEFRQAAFGHPAGYSKAFITLYNFRRLPDNDAISYWARN